MNDLTIYDSQAAHWWDGSVRWLRTLHNMVPARLRYFDTFVKQWDGLIVLDVGCGGGFMSEAIAQRGARVLAVDPAAKAIDVARKRAATSGLLIDYQVGTGEVMNLADNSVDVVVCVDVLEHVQSVPRTLAEIARVLRPGGLFAFDTINRNPLSRFAVITCAENVLGFLPKGTHDPNLFIKPGELTSALEQLGFEPIGLAGLGPTGVNRDLDFTFGRVPLTLIQYMGVARRVRATQ
ncbi:MAG: bifunctional 2-polyprenyl-6-hydroxyphenol methylase/3-demethylubiquinol 3-O-methyltransferase UbiG [Pseudomonadota bacterium]